MNNIQSILKKALKVILWIAGSLLLLLIIIVSLIQLPSIQNRIIHYATSTISNKTHTRAEIKNVSFSFPESVVFEGVYLEDLNKDTLISAGKVKINIALLNLLRHRININSFILENVTIRLSTTKIDSLFNYNFLLTAFSDSSAETKTPSESQWKFNLDNATLKKIHFYYDDEYRGMLAAAVLGSLDVKMDELNLPLIRANKIQLENSILSLSDSINKLSVNASVKHFELSGGSIDMQNKIAKLDELALSKSEIHYYSGEKVSTPDPVSASHIPYKESDWKVDVKKISLEDNVLSYQSEPSPIKRNVFNAKYLIFSHLTLQVSDLSYSIDSSRLSVKKFSATDQNNFSITKFETDFSIDQHSASLKKLKASTINSSVEAELHLKYSSLKALKDSIPFLALNLNMQNVRIKNSDITYFDQTLAKQSFFKNADNITSLSGIIKGPVKDLKGENIIIKTGNVTTLKTDFNISGLPLVDSTHFVFPNLIIKSGRSDIEMMTGSSISKNIRIPESLSLNVSFNGQIRAFASTMSLDCSYGNVKLIAAIGKNENFKARVNIAGFDLGALLGDSSIFGPVTLIAQANGRGLNMNSVEADISAELSELYLNKYVYHNLSMDGKIRGQEFTGKISLDDENAVFDFEGLVNLNQKNENFNFKLSVKGANLQKLNITHDDIRIGFNAFADLKGEGLNELNGNAGIKNIIIAKGEKKYVLDSLLFAFINSEKKSELNLSSSIVGIKYSGTVSPADISVELKNFFNNYFPLPGGNEIKKDRGPVNFNFEIILHNHPILSQLLFPGLKEFEPGPITGSFNSEKNDLKLNAAIKKIIYGNSDIRNLIIDINSNSGSLNYKISSSMLSSSQIKLDNFSFDGKFSDNTIFANLSSTADNKDRKIVINTQITNENTNYKLVVDPDNFYLMNNKWNIAPDNYIEFGKEGILIHNFFINNSVSQINIASVQNKFNDDLDIGIKNFNLDDISRVIEKDTSLIKGKVEGNVLLKKVNNKYGLIADLKINDIVFRGIPAGTLTVKADNSTAEKFDIDLKLSGAGNNLASKGYFIPEGEGNTLNIKTEVQSLSMKTLEAFSMGQIREAGGTISGNLLINGSAGEPIITGELLFNDVSVKPSLLNNKLELKHETIRLGSDGIYFDSFTLLDVNKHSAVIDGSIHMKEFKDLNFALNISTTDFLLFNSTMKDNRLFYGKMVIDSKIDITGPMALPVINGRVNIKDESKFTFVVPESRITTDRGEGVVEFADSRLNQILSDTGKIEKKSSFTGFDISTIIEIDKQAELRLQMDPSSSDSLVVKGGAALSLVIDRSGKMSLTGSYNLEKGSYIVSLEFVKRKFDIISGSSIIWNGDPLDAKISINTKYIVRASPYDLMSRQLSGMGDAEQGSYKQPYPFWVLLNLQGDILHPDIKFEIQLPPENKGILGGSVNQKLLMLKEDESELNKQVFALLVLGRFVQENPLQTESGGTSTLIRSTVGNFLSAQLNKFSSQALPGMELNFDIQSYNEYETGQAKGRTQVEVGVKKQLFDERLSVQVGGSVDVEGERARQNSNSNITGDVNIEYKLTDDGRLRMKAFRHNQYEGAIEGQLVETGAGIVYIREFDRWKEFLKPLRKRVIH